MKGNRAEPGLCGRLMRGALFMAAFIGVSGVIESAHAQQAGLGINTAFVNQTRVFKNLMAQSNGWIAVNADYPFQGSVTEYSNPDAPNYQVVTTRSEDQYPVDVNLLQDVAGTDLMAFTMIFPNGPDNGEFAAGQYQLVFEGAGEVVLAGAPANGENTARITVNADPSGMTTRTLNFAAAPGESLEGVLLGIRSTDNSNPVRNIQIVESAYADPASAEYHLNQPFNPAYIQHLQTINPEMLRTMNFSHVVGGHACSAGGTDRSAPGCSASWADRVTTAHANQTGEGGMALEYIIDLANTLGVDLWLNIPHNAEKNDSDPSRDYATQMAQLVNARLDPSLNVVVEYSNETWNNSGEFAIAHDFTVNAGAQEVSTQHPGGMSANEYFVFRQVDAINAFRAVLGESRVEAVMPAQAGNTQVARERIAALASPVVNPPTPGNPHGLMFEAVAGAAYFGIESPYDALSASNSGGPPFSVDSLLDLAEADIPHVLASFSDIRQALQAENLVDGIHLGLDYKMVAYEGGQHLSPLNVDNGFNFYTETDFNSVAEYEAFIDVLNAANRHERMFALYTQLMAGWVADSNNGVLNLFQDVGAFTEFGAFGLSEYLGQTISLGETPKLAAVVAFNSSAQVNSVPVWALMCGAPLWWLLGMLVAGIRQDSDQR